MCRILIADDHEVVRAGLRQILEARPDWEIVAEAADGKEAVLKAIETRPDVAIIDHSLPLMNGIEVTRRIRARLPATEVLIFTVDDHDSLIKEVLTAGARGYLLKSDSNKTIVEAVETLLAHQPFFTGIVSTALLRSFLALPKHTWLVLTHRERSVVRLVAQGHSNRRIGELLQISLKTVESDRAAAMYKLQLTSSAGLVRYAIRNKLLDS